MGSYPTSLQRGGLVTAWSARWHWVAAMLAASLLAFGSAAARADDDLPGRVGRISDFGGDLFLSPEDRAGEWQPVGLNYPVTSGDNLWVGGEGRAEVDYGGGQFRLAGDTNLHVSRLDENQIALFIAQGRVIVRVRVLDPGDAARIDAPNTQIQLTRAGLYRIDVTPDRDVTTIVVREGEAVVALAGSAQQALPGQMVSVVGTDPNVAEVRNGIGQDGFDTWSADRDRHYDRPRSTAYVSRQMVGSADLDEYGSWQQTPDYGPVWYPGTVAADWAPYRDGYWADVGGWGTTWVDAAPWGYAPFHYGRWMRIGGRWGWCPGAYAARPIWAPALVGWYGGAGWGMSSSLGSPVYGWVPLAWGEAYHPWWRRCTYNCWATYNRPYAVNVTVRPNHPPAQYRNVGVPGAVTAVAGATLAGHLPVASNRVPVPAQQLATAPVLASAPAVPAGPRHIPGTRPGAAGTPPPASTFYPVSRAGRQAGEVVRPSTGGTGARTPVTGTASGRPGAATGPGTAASRTRPAPLPEPAPGAAAASPPPTASTGTEPPFTRRDTVQRPRGQPPQAAGVPTPPVASPQPSRPAPAAAANTPTPTPRGEDVRRQRQQQPVASTSSAQAAGPLPAPVARPAPTRPPASERIGPMPPPQVSRGLPAGASVAAPAQAIQAPASRITVQGVPAAPVHAGGQPDHVERARQAVPKVEPASGTPVKQ